MATDHGLSVLINSCIKVPINPLTGKPATMNERLKGSENYENVKVNDSISDHASPRVLKNGVSKEAMADLINLNGEEFYERLQELKREQTRTLEIIERLYNEKFFEAFSHTPVKSWGIDNSFENSISQLHKPSPENGNNFTSSPTNKEVSDSMEKDFSPCLNNSSRTSPIRNKQSSDSINSLSYIDSEYGYEDNGNRKTMSAMSYIDYMWENFSIDDYAQKIKKRPFVTGSLRSVKSDKGLKVTIPKPFSMTVRESLKSPQKSVKQTEAENIVLQKRISEEIEIGKKFKANPVPAHTFLPLYKNIVAKREERRIQSKEKRKNVLEADIRPFNLGNRSTQCDHHRSHSLPETFKTTFKARPVPKYINSCDVHELMKEEELYRKINKEIRQQKLLQSSQLPPNMQKSPIRKHNHKLDSNAVKLFSPQIHRNVPNFAAIHKKLMFDRNKNKEHKESTICKPFTLYTSQRKSKDKKPEEISNSLREEKSRPSSSLSEQPKAKMTVAAQLRQIATKKFLENVLHKELAELEQVRQHKLKEFKLKPFITARALALTPSRAVEESIRARLDQFRQAEHAREKEYRKDLKAMKERVEQRPFLFERLTETNAQKMAENHFTNTLRKAGIDVDEFFKASKELLSERSSTDNSRNNSRNGSINFYSANEDPSELESNIQSGEESDECSEKESEDDEAGYRNDNEIDLQHIYET